MPGASLPTQRPTLADSLTDGVLSLIRDRHLMAGDALPGVRDLASQFGVTAPTIREALRRLEATGAVRFRHGSGIYVGPDVGRVLLANPHVLELSPEATVELLDTRLLIEPGIAAVAAERRSDEHLVQLENALLGSVTQPANDGCEQRNLSFHRALAAATGNSVTYQLVDSLLTVRGSEQRVVRALLKDRERDQEQHRQLVAAVRQRDADAARAAMDAHLRDVRRVVLEELQRLRAPEAPAGRPRAKEES